MSAPALYIPIEVKARELRGKTFLALKAAAAGQDVYLGQAGAIQVLARRGPEGVFVDKNVNPRRRALFRSLRAAGHAVVAWDEEALAVLDLDWYITKNVKPDMLAEVDRFLVWGEAERAAIARRFPALAERLSVAGNPRADVLRPENRAMLEAEGAARRAEHGPYILLISSFSRVNLFSGTREDFVAQITRSFDLDAEQVAFLRGSLDHAQAIFEEVRAIVPRLAADFPDRTIVIRPHPAENQETWRTLARDLPNVRVIGEHDAVSWIAGASAVVHNGCTTAVEAYLMGRLALAYQPITSAAFDVDLPNALSLSAATYEGLVAQIRNEVDREPKCDPDRPEWRERLPLAREAVASIDGPFAAERIVAVADALRREPVRSFAAGRFRWDALLDRLKSDGLRFAKDTKARLSARGRDPTWRSLAARERQKFPGLALRELEMLRDGFGAVDPDVRGVAISPLGVNAFRLSRSRA